MAAQQNYKKKQQKIEGQNKQWEAAVYERKLKISTFNCKKKL